jgi:dihydrofolate synthase/folylpolyglutamate synthase
VAWLYGLQHVGVKLGLDNITALLALLGRPDRAYRSILVAGTNGKGSVAAMLAAVLAEHGVRTGLFTSPHLVRPNERIRVGDDDVSDAELDSGLGFLRRTIEDGLAAGRLSVHPSFFEVVTACAARTFRDRGVEAAVFEVGLGGRLDATNAIDADLAVVVGIGFDHMAILGDSLAAIAREKGGIVKPGRPVASGVVQQTAIDALRAIAALRDAPWIEARLAISLESVSPDRREITLAGRRRYPDLRLALAGSHQIDNARIALAAFEAFAARAGIDVDPAAVRRGLERTRWPGRLQWIRPAGSPALLLDGAHNPAGARALARYLSELEAKPWAVLGAMRGKDVPGIVRPIAPHVAGMTVTRPAVDRAAPAEEVAAVARQHAERVEVAERPAEALDRARVSAGPDGVVLVTGSLYLVGEVLGLLEGRPVPGPVAM